MRFPKISFSILLPSSPILSLFLSINQWLLIWENNIFFLEAFPNSSNQWIVLSLTLASVTTISHLWLYFSSRYMLQARPNPSVFILFTSSVYSSLPITNHTSVKYPDIFIALHYCVFYMVPAKESSSFQLLIVYFWDSIYPKTTLWELSLKWVWTSWLSTCHSALKLSYLVLLFQVTLPLLRVLPQPEMRHWVPSAAQDLGRETVATWELMVAAELSLISMMSLSMVAELYSGWRIILAAFMNCSLPS